MPHLTTVTILVIFVFAVTTGCRAEAADVPADLAAGGSNAFPTTPTGLLMFALANLISAAFGGGIGFRGAKQMGVGKDPTLEATVSRLDERSIATEKRLDTQDERMDVHADDMHHLVKCVERLREVTNVEFPDREDRWGARRNRRSADNTPPQNKPGT